MSTGKDEFVGDAHDGDPRRHDQRRLEAVLVERLDGGEMIEMDDADFRRIRETAAARLATREKQSKFDPA